MPETPELIGYISCSDGVACERLMDAEGPRRFELAAGDKLETGAPILLTANLSQLRRDLWAQWEQVLTQLPSAGVGSRHARA